MIDDEIIKDDGEIHEPEDIEDADVEVEKKKHLLDDDVESADDLAEDELEEDEEESFDDVDKM